MDLPNEGQGDSLGLSTNAQRVERDWNPLTNSQDQKSTPRILCGKKDQTTYAKGFTGLIKIGTSSQLFYSFVSVNFIVTQRLEEFDCHSLS